MPDHKPISLLATKYRSDLDILKPKTQELLDHLSEVVSEIKKTEEYPEPWESRLVTLHEELTTLLSITGD